MYSEAYKIKDLILIYLENCDKRKQFEMSITYFICIFSGVIKNRNNGVGVVIEGRKRCVYWCYATCFQFVCLFNEVSSDKLNAESGEY